MKISSLRHFFEWIGPLWDFRTGFQEICVVFIVPLPVLVYPWLKGLLSFFSASFSSLSLESSSFSNLWWIPTEVLKSQECLAGGTGEQGLLSLLSKICFDLPFLGQRKQTLIKCLCPYILHSSSELDIFHVLQKPKNSSWKSLKLRFFIFIYSFTIYLDIYYRISSSSTWRWYA